MRHKSFVLLLVALSFAGSLPAMPPDSLLTDKLKQHISYLASDKLAGRLTGSKGEKEASNYIVKQYREMGLQPKGVNGSYLQPFSFNYGKKVSGTNSLVINGTTLVIHEDYYPLNISGNKSVKGKITDVGFGIIAPDLAYDSYKNLSGLKESIYLMECSTPEGDNPHSKFSAYADLKSRIANAKQKGAIAVIFTNTQLNADDLNANLDINSIATDIPVVFIKAAALKRVLKSELNSAQVTTHLDRVSVTGHNVAGFLDNGSSETIVIGAHYDHLGEGEYGNSLYRGPHEIHNGADDNASGTAAVIELARYLQTNGVTEKNNYLFLNFSGEEEGLIGSKYWVEHATLDTSRINYMINIDMIGRYDTGKGMEISGLGTSPEKFSFIHQLSFRDLKFKYGENGTGPSDHTSFYYANIPVLNFFTGTHEDYHKPTDDADKINYPGEAEAIQYIETIVMQLDTAGILSFSKTKETGNEDIPQFKVRLGIIPDYLFEGPGLRVDGVDEGKPAAVAGINKGDIILAIGDHKVGDIMEYMNALAAYQKGDSVKVRLKRGDSNIEKQVVF